MNRAQSMTTIKHKTRCSLQKQGTSTGETHVQFADSMAESTPGGQVSHFLEPNSAENLPAGQDRHTALPIEVKWLNVPGTHSSIHSMLAPYLTTLASTQLRSCASPPCTSNKSSTEPNPWKYLPVGGSPKESTCCQTCVSVANWYMSFTNSIPPR